MEPNEFYNIVNDSRFDPKDPEESQAICRAPDTGELVTFTWTHRNCGGSVYPDNYTGAFTCNRCRVTGEIGAEFPEGMTDKNEQMVYLIEHIGEVDLLVNGVITTESIDRIIVKKCLREWAKDLQAQREIPPPVSEAELYEYADGFIDEILTAIRRNKPLYAHLQEEGAEHFEAVLKDFIQNNVEHHD